MKRIYEFYKNNILLAVAGILFISVIYGYRLVHPTIGVDTETILTAYEECLLWFAGLGRFFCAFLRHAIMPFGYNYSVAFVLAICFLSLTFLLLTYAFDRYGLSKGSSSLVFFSLFFSFPVFAEVFYFANQSDVIAIGMFLSTCSTLMICDGIFFRKGILNYLSGCILGVLAVGCYQAFLYFCISEILAFSILKVVFSEKESSANYWCYAFKLVMTIIFVTISYFSVNYIVQNNINISEITYMGVKAETYLSNSILWKKVLASNCLKSIWLYIVQTLRWDNPFGSPVCYGLLLADIVLLIGKYIREKNIKYIYGALLFIALAVTPFLGAVVRGMGMTIREQIVLPFVFAFSAAFFCHYLKDMHFLKKLVITGLLLISWHQASVTLNLFHTDLLRYESDKARIQQIIQDAESKFGPVHGKVIVYNGVEKWPLPEDMLRGEVVGYSILEWDGETSWGANYRINYFSKSLGLTQQIPTMEQIKKGYELTADLDSWPASNSMVMEDNLIAIKLSEK